jgi:UTP--glucose-1-phosphate uridylyltransferase
MENSPSNLAIIGRYLLTPTIFEVLEKTERGSGGEIQLTDGLQRLLAHEPIYAYKFRGKRYDAGEKLGFLKTTVEFALKNPELGAEFRSYLQSLNLNEF